MADKKISKLQESENKLRAAETKKADFMANRGVLQGFGDAFVKSGGKLGKLADVLIKTSDEAGQGVVDAKQNLAFEMSLAQNKLSIESGKQSLANSKKRGEMDAFTFEQNKKLYPLAVATAKANTESAKAKAVVNNFKAKQSSYQEKLFDHSVKIQDKITATGRFNDADAVEVMGTESMKDMVRTETTVKLALQHGMNDPETQIALEKQGAFYNEENNTLFFAEAGITIPATLEALQQVSPQLYEDAAGEAQTISKMKETATLFGGMTRNAVTNQLVKSGYGSSNADYVNGENNGSRKKSFAAVNNWRKRFGGAANRKHDLIGALGYMLDNDFIEDQPQQAEKLLRSQGYRYKQVTDETGKVKMFGQKIADSDPTKPGYQESPWVTPKELLEELKKTDIIGKSQDEFLSSMGVQQETAMTGNAMDVMKNYGIVYPVEWTDQSQRKAGRVTQVVIDNALKIYKETGSASLADQHYKNKMATTGIDKKFWPNAFDMMLSKKESSITRQITNLMNNAQNDNELQYAITRARALRDEQYKLNETRKELGSESTMNATDKGRVVPSEDKINMERKEAMKNLAGFRDRSKKSKAEKEKVERRKKVDKQNKQPTIFPSNRP